MMKISMLIRKLKIFLYVSLDYYEISCENYVLRLNVMKNSFYCNGILNVNIWF